ncbi:VOC family protein [Streptomyces violens]|uniref:VOC family protein n=1 Tax=Streptomyces violens TaxID=66377 RepID=UPI0004BF4A23|nr:VOC family protein [Streptomyces violens]
MPKVTGPYAPGTPCWADLTVPDQQAALDFYRDLFGWQGEIGPPETGGYAVCTLNGEPVAGIMAAMNPDGSVPDPMPPAAWTTYLATADVDTTQNAITTNGGQVIMPGMDVLTLGRMAVISDPTNAVFGLWQARDFPGAGIVNEPGAIIWNELNTSDPDTASSFYSTTVGLTAAPMEGAQDYYSLSADGRMVGGMQDLATLEDLPPDVPSHWLPYFSVDDADSTVAALVRSGGNVLKPPFDMMAGRMAILQDPQNATFAIINTS